MRTNAKLLEDREILNLVFFHSFSKEKNMKPVLRYCREKIVISFLVRHGAQPWLMEVEITSPMNGDIVSIGIVLMKLWIKHARHILVQNLTTHVHFPLHLMEQNIIIVLLQKTDVENHGVQLKILKMLATWNQEVGDIVIIIVLMANYLNKTNFHTSEIRQSFPIVYSLTYLFDF